MVPRPWDVGQAHRWQWLSSTAELQSEIYGHNLNEMALSAIQRRASPELTHYLDWNTTAAVQELAELREEFSWKPWATDEPFAHRDRIIAESVDVLHFIGNILVGLGVTDEELEERYQTKQRINVSRQESGTYSAQKGHISEGSD